MTATKADIRDLFQRILETPDDDAPRLIYADAIQESGDDARAEFIRLMILDYSWPIAENASERVRELADEFGKQWFPETEGVKGFEISRGFASEVHLTVSAFVGYRCSKCNGRGLIESPSLLMPCRWCAGTGRIPSIAKDLFLQHPITRVELTDLVIHPNGGRDTYYLGDLGSFPQKYWGRLDFLPSRSAVKEATCKVCVEYGRELAGLPPLF